MAGIFGTVGGRPEANSAALLAEMAARMRHHPWYSERLDTDEATGTGLGQMALGPTGPGALSAQDESGTLRIVLAGEIYDGAEHRRALSAAGHRFTGTGAAELLLHGYRHEGRTFFRKLHGKFAAALWDARTRRLVLVNDRFGMKPLYFTRLPGRLLFASEIKALLADPAMSRRPSPRGVAQFFTFGQLLGEDTLLEDVQLLPAAGWLIYEVGTDRLTVDRYWHLTARPTRNATEAIDRIDDAFGRAVERCTAGTTGLGLSLSGGMDSRMILARAARPGRSLTTLSLGIPGGLDHRSASALAHLAGCPHHQVPLDEWFLTHYEDHLRQMVRLTDGQYLCQCIVLPTLPIYRDLGIRVLLRGHAGELLHMTKAYNFSLDRQALAIGDEAGLLEWLWRHLPAYLLAGTHGRLFVPKLRDEVEALARSSLALALRETAATEPTAHRIWHLFLNQRLRRETALSLVEFDSVVETRLPYLDNEIIDALFEAPPELKLDNTIQERLLRRHRPDFLNVVNVNTGARVDAGRLAQAVGKLRHKYLAKLGVRGYQPYERLGLWLRRELRPLVERLLLSDRCLSRGVFDADTVRTIVGTHLASRGNHTFLLLALMIFEVGQQELIDPVVSCQLSVVS